MNTEDMSVPGAALREPAAGGVQVSIGEFSRLTHVSIKALRHYHEVGLLRPVEVDPWSGYRRYHTGQVGDAALIRRLRELQMPISQIKEVISAADPDQRNRVLLGHLEGMEADLERSRAVIASLRGWLEPALPAVRVEYRHSPAFPAYAVTARVDRADISAWCAEAFERLYLAAVDSSARVAGPAAATYDDAFFGESAGGVVAYLPVAEGSPVPSAVELKQFPAADFAITLHAGPFTEIDRSYAALGSHVARHSTVAPGPIREVYLIGPDHTDQPSEYRTEVCWPVQPA